MKKYRVGILGATGMVGQRFVTLMQSHPWFELTVLAASASSAEKTYAEAVRGRWAFPWPIPQQAAERIVYDAADVNAVASQCDFVFCAVSLDKAAPENWRKAMPGRKRLWSAITAPAGGWQMCRC